MAQGNNWWGNVADAFIPGDAYGPNGWDRQALTTGLLQMGGNMLAPGLGTLGGVAFKGFQGQNPFSGLAGLFGGRNPAINQMANPNGSGYDLKPWSGIGLPAMGNNPFAATYTPPQQGMPGNFGGGARGAFTFGGYANADHRNASMAATQQALRDAATRSPNNRQLSNWQA